MMKAYFIGALVASALGSVTQAGTLGPELQETLAGGDPRGDIPVIVRFADRIDLKALRKDVARTLKEQYPDPKERKAARKQLKRAILVERLKEKAKKSAQLVRKFLKSKGETR